MSEAISSFQRQDETRVIDPHGKLEADAIRSRLEAMGPKTGQLGAVGLHNLRQVEIGTRTALMDGVKSPLLDR